MMAKTEESFRSIYEGNNPETWEEFRSGRRPLQGKKYPCARIPFVPGALFGQCGMVSSAVDIVAAHAESKDAPNYWRVFKKRLSDGANKTITRCNGFKLLILDGKMCLCFFTERGHFLSGWGVKAAS
jgi:hypothetical protein